MSHEPFDPEGVTWTPVSPALAAARRLVVGGFLGLGLLVAVIAAVASGLAIVWLAPVLVGAVLAWAWWTIGRQVRALGYAEREQELLVRRGIMWRSIVVVPYGRLQFVDIEAGPLDRLLGIARVRLHTASASADASIPGLASAEAARLRDHLTERGETYLAGL